MYNYIRLSCDAHMSLLKSPPAASLCTPKALPPRYHIAHSELPLQLSLPLRAAYNNLHYLQRSLPLRAAYNNLHYRHPINSLDPGRCRAPKEDGAHGAAAKNERVSEPCTSFHDFLHLIAVLIFSLRYAKLSLKPTKCLCQVYSGLSVFSVIG